MAITKILAHNKRMDVAIKYVTNGSKTEDQILTAYLNCDPGRAYRQMMETKEEIGKTGGRQCYHIIHSLYYEVVVFIAPLQGLCYTVWDAVDWFFPPTAQTVPERLQPQPFAVLLISLDTARRFISNKVTRAKCPVVLNSIEIVRRRYQDGLRWN